MRLLCTADLHLGRRASALPPGAGEACRAARVWGDLVRLACDEGVDALLLAGDLVDRDEGYQIGRASCRERV
jgi:DNA repair protein SbcD/Mre11